MLCSSTTEQFQGNHQGFTQHLKSLHVFLRTVKCYIKTGLLFYAAGRMQCKIKLATYKCSVFRLWSNLSSYQSASCSKRVFHSGFQKLRQNHKSSQEVSHQAFYRWHLIEHCLKFTERPPALKYNHLGSLFYS